jgi:hypothetical protein
MRSRRRSSEDLVDALTRAALGRDTAEALELVHELGKGRAPSPELVASARACGRRLRSVEQLRKRLGLEPFPSARAIAV